MTQRNGTIEFIKKEDQQGSVYIQEIRKIVRFDGHSGKLFTSDPLVIKKLDSLGYERGKVKVNGVAVFASEMTEDEKKIAQKGLDKIAEKKGVEAPKLDISEDIIVDSKEAEVIEEKDSVEEVSEDVKEKEDGLQDEEQGKEEKVEKAKVKKAKKSKASSLLKKEIES